MQLELGGQRITSRKSPTLRHSPVSALCCTPFRFFCQNCTRPHSSFHYKLHTPSAWCDPIVQHGNQKSAVPPVKPKPPIAKNTKLSPSAIQARPSNPLAPTPQRLSSPPYMSCSLKGRLHRGEHRGPLQGSFSGEILGV